MPTPYKILLEGDELYIYGYVRSFYLNGSTTSEDIMIPFRLELNKTNYAINSFVINHTDINATDGYPSQDIGFLNATMGSISASFQSNHSAIYAPEMACHYRDAENNLQWAMIGYFDRAGGAPLDFELHCLSSEQVECNPLDRTMVFDDPLTLINDPPKILPIGDCNYISGAIVRSTISLNDNSCN